MLRGTIHIPPILVVVWIWSSPDAKVVPHKDISVMKDARRSSFMSFTCRRSGVPWHHNLLRKADHPVAEPRVTLDLKRRETQQLAVLKLTPLEARSDFMCRGVSARMSHLRERA
jgi:hypothetical protein